MPQSDPSKTEKPTPKRIKKAREKGQVPKSQEVSNGIIILAGISILFAWLAFIGREMSDIFRYFMGNAIVERFDPTPQSIGALAPALVKELAKMVLPISLTVGLCAGITARIQVGKLWSPKIMKPNFKKMNPLPGLKRIFFSMGTLTRLLKSLLKSIAIGIAPIIVVAREVPNLPNLYYLDASGLAYYMLSMAFKIAIYALVPMLIIAIADLIYTRWDYIENLKMTKDEVKDEMKQMEGDPKVKQKQRQKMMQMSMRRMMQNVPKADVVITNPTHLAVALRYYASEAPAPMVVAKGADRVAEKIKEIARENKIPIKENKPLARALYHQLEVGDMIPEDLYKAVASILAQVWKTKPPQPTTVQKKP